MHVLFENSKEGILKQKLELMNFHHTKWLDLNNPTIEELKQVSKKIEISVRDLTRYLDKDEMPRISQNEHYDIIILKSPKLANHSKYTKTTSITFMISENLIITLHEEPITAIEELIDETKTEKERIFTQGTNEILFTLLENIRNNYFKSLDELEIKIDKIEETVYSKPEQKTVKKIFSLKRTLIYFQKGLAANRDVLVLLQKQIEHTKSKKQRRISHLYYDYVQLIDVIATYRDILTGSLDIYLSSVSNNMNLVMKKMAAFGSLVLVPTFITGLYGMNFEKLPELQWEYGYLFAWSLIIVSIVGLIIYFKKKDWF